jgi:hypothetical protein
MLLLTHFLVLYNVFDVGNNLDVLEVHYVSLFRVEVSKCISANGYIYIFLNITRGMGDPVPRFERIVIALSYLIDPEDGGGKYLPNIGKLPTST